jgi:hypothetical protein
LKENQKPPRLRRCRENLGGFFLPINACSVNRARRSPHLSLHVLFGGACCANPDDLFSGFNQGFGFMISGRMGFDF